MLRTSVIGCLLGLTLGFLCGAVTTWLTPSSGVPRDPSVEAVETVNQRTGKPQVHLQGKPDIK